MPKPVVKKDCKGKITAASEFPQKSGKATLTKTVCPPVNDLIVAEPPSVAPVPLPIVEPTTPIKEEKPLKSIIETLTDMGFTQLVNAIKTTGFVDVLNRNIPFTVFAPSEDAFTAAQETLKDLDLLELADVVTYHLVAGEFKENALAQLSTPLNTFNGAATPLTFSFPDEDDQGSLEQLAFIVSNGERQAKIERRDILATNGVIHVIDTVMVPDVLRIGEFIKAEPKFSTLASAFETAELLDVLNQNGQFTLFAPDNIVFKQVPLDDLEALLSNKEALEDVLLYHITAEVDADDLVNGQKIRAAQGGKIQVTVENGNIFIDDALLVTKDIELANGKIQVISQLLDPERNEILPGEVESIDVDGDGTVDITIRYVNNTENSYVIELIEDQVERFICSRISRDGNLNGNILVDELSTGEVRIDVNGDTYMCVAIPACTPVAEVPKDEDPIAGNDTIVVDNPVSVPIANDTINVTDVPVIDTIGNDTIEAISLPTLPGGDAPETTDTISGNTGNDTSFGTVIGIVPDTDDTVVGGDTIAGTGNDTIADEKDEEDDEEDCVSEVITLNYNETVSTLRELAKGITFSTESDFKAEINPNRVNRLPTNGKIVSADRIAAMVPNRENNTFWEQFASLANSLPFSIWRFPRNRRNDAGVSNTDYIINLFHEEGTIQIRIRAVET